MTVSKNNRGAVIIFVALFSLLMLSLIGLAIDGAWITYVRNQAQARVDAAALAGASAISDGETEVDRRADAFSSQNSIANLTVDPENEFIVPILYEPANSLCGASGICTAGITFETANGITVTNAIPTPLFFSRLLNGGVPTTEINVAATAISGYHPDLPVALLDCQVPNPAPGVCAAVTLKLSPSTIDNAAITCYFSPNTNAAACRELVENPVTAPCLAPGSGTQITVNNGVVGSCFQAIEDKFHKQPGNTWDVTVPVISCANLVGRQGNVVQSQELLRLARIRITNVVSTGGSKRIEGSICGGGLGGSSPCTRLVR